MVSLDNIAQNSEEFDADLQGLVNEAKSALKKKLRETQALALRARMILQSVQKAKLTFLIDLFS